MLTNYNVIYDDQVRDDNTDVFDRLWPFRRYIYVYTILYIYCVLLYFIIYRQHSPYRERPSALVLFTRALVVQCRRRAVSSHVSHRSAYRKTFLDPSTPLFLSGEVTIDLPVYRRFIVFGSLARHLLHDGRDEWTATMLWHYYSAVSELYTFLNFRWLATCTGNR